MTSRHKDGELAQAEPDDAKSQSGGGRQEGAGSVVGGVGVLSEELEDTEGLPPVSPWLLGHHDAVWVAFMCALRRTASPAMRSSVST